MCICTARVYISRAVFSKALTLSIYCDVYMYMYIHVHVLNFLCGFVKVFVCLCLTILLFWATGLHLGGWVIFLYTCSFIYTSLAKCTIHMHSHVHVHVHVYIHMKTLSVFGGVVLYITLYVVVCVVLSGRSKFVCQRATCSAVYS